MGIHGDKNQTERDYVLRREYIYGDHLISLLVA